MQRDQAANATFHAVLAVVAVFAVIALADEDSPDVANPQAVEEVLAGKRDVANAAWWGFDSDDATQALQAAIDSGAKQVIVPNVGSDWIVRPVTLASDQELVFEKGVVVTAMRGEFRGTGDSLFTANNVSHLTIRGEGATFRMQKEDYIIGKLLGENSWSRSFGRYEQAEWRMALALRGCSDVEITGLTLRDSGGDGIYIDGSKRNRCSSNIRIRNVVCDNNYRQGISVISVDGLLVEDSTFKNTWGTPPSAGVDIEPDAADQQLKNIVFRNCRFENNYGDGILIYLTLQTAESDDVSILFENCRVSSRRGPGIRVSKIADDGPGGVIEFRDCTIENTEGQGITIQDKSAVRTRVKFVRCKLRGVARDRNYQGPWAPIWFDLQQPGRVAQFGGIDFIDCHVADHRDRMVVGLSERIPPMSLSDITGTITLSCPNGAASHVPAELRDAVLQVLNADR